MQINIRIKNIVLLIQGTSEDSTIPALKVLQSPLARASHSEWILSAESRCRNQRVFVLAQNSMSCK